MKFHISHRCLSYLSAQFQLDGNTCVHAVTKFMFKKVHGGHMRALMQLKPLKLAPPCCSGRKLNTWVTTTRPRSGRSKPKKKVFLFLFNIYIQDGVNISRLNHLLSFYSTLHLPCYTHHKFNNSTRAVDVVIAT